MHKYVCFCVCMYVGVGVGVCVRTAHACMYMHVCTSVLTMYTQYHNDIDSFDIYCITKCQKYT